MFRSLYVKDLVDPVRPGLAGKSSLRQLQILTVSGACQVKSEIDFFPYAGTRALLGTITTKRFSNRL